MKSGLTTKTLRSLAWRAGYHGVLGVAQAAGIARTTAYRAVANPLRHPRAFAALRRVLAKGARP